MPGAELQILARIPIFEPLAQPALERLSWNLQPAMLARAPNVITEGERGDLFYVIQEGTASVISGGAPVATLGPGDYFGEIALLRNVPRTATVRAETDLELLTLEQEEFLAAVTGSQSECSAGQRRDRSAPGRAPATDRDLADLVMAPRLCHRTATDRLEPSSEAEPKYGWSPSLRTRRPRTPRPGPSSILLFACDPVPMRRGRIRGMHEVSIPIRWRDVDNYGHVNNAVYLNYLEECRDRLVDDLFGTDEAWDFVLARVAIDYRSELTQADGEVRVRCGVRGFGTSSVRTWERVEKRDGSLAAEAESVIVPRDPTEGTEPSAHRRREGRSCRRTSMPGTAPRDER